MKRNQHKLFQTKVAIKLRKASKDLLIFEISPHRLVKGVTGVQSLKMYVSRKCVNNVHPTVPDTSPNTPPLSVGGSTRAHCHSLITVWWTMLNLSCKVHPSPGFELDDIWVTCAFVYFLIHFLCMRRAVLPHSWLLFKPCICVPPPPFPSHTQGKICLPEKHLFVIIPAAFGAWLGDPLTCLNVRAQRWDCGPTTSWVWTNCVWSHCHITWTENATRVFGQRPHWFVTHLFAQQNRFRQIMLEDRVGECWPNIIPEYFFFN